MHKSQYQDAGNKTLRGYQLGKLDSCLTLPQTAVSGHQVPLLESAPAIKQVKD